MQLVVVIRQLTAVLDELLLRVTRSARVTPEDALVLAWMVQESGIGGARLARCVARKRQSVQRSLERLERRGLVQRLESCVRDRTAGWSLTEEGREQWQILERGFRAHDEALNRTENLRNWVVNLECLVKAVAGVARTRFSLEPNLIEPPEESETPDWDL